MTTRRCALHRLGALAVGLGAVQAAHGATIVAVRVWPAEAYTRVAIESDEPLDAKHFLLSDPRRLVVDIDGLELNDALRELVGKIEPDDPDIALVRVGQYKPTVVRLVFDLKRAVQPQQFTLSPAAAYRFRLVFDLQPVIPDDPLLALLQDRADADKRAARALQRSLDDLVARVDRPSSARPRPGKTPVRRAVPRGEVERLIVVAIDPGHGGEDPGAIGVSGLYEKDVVLAIALQLRDRLDATPGMRAMLTRDEDFYVPLQERVRKARRVQADLLVSIHADAFMRPQARGASVFALSTNGATSAAARWMARRENAADVVGGVNLKVADRQVVGAMLDMSTHAQISDSLKIGREVLQRMGRVGRLHKDRVEQAGFAVLKAPDIPSILVETGFITNPEEEALLSDPDYQRRMVDALGSGIERYFANHPPLVRRRQL